MTGVPARVARQPRSCHSAFPTARRAQVRRVLAALFAAAVLSVRPHKANHGETAGVSSG